MFDLFGNIQGRKSQFVNLALSDLATLEYKEFILKQVLIRMHRFSSVHAYLRSVRICHSIDGSSQFCCDEVKTSKHAAITLLLKYLLHCIIIIFCIRGIRRNIRKIAFRATVSLTCHQLATTQSQHLSGLKNNERSVNLDTLEIAILFTVVTTDHTIC